MRIFSTGRAVSKLWIYFYFSDFSILAIFLKKFLPFASDRCVQTSLKLAKNWYFFDWTHRFRVIAIFLIFSLLSNKNGYELPWVITHGVITHVSYPLPMGNPQNLPIAHGYQWYGLPMGG